MKRFSWKLKLFALICLPLTALAATATAEEETPAEADFYIFHTDPGSGLTQNEIIWQNWLIDTEDTLLPLVFEGDLDTNTLSVYFNGNPLESYNSLESLQDEVSLLIVDTSAYIGQQADLKVVFKNTGSEPSLIATPVETRNTEAIEKAVQALHPEPGSKNEGGAFAGLILLSLLFLRRRFA